MSRRVRTVLRQGSFSGRVVNAWSGLSRKVVAVSGVDKVKWELDRFLDTLETDRYGDISKTCW